MTNAYVPPPRINSYWSGRTKLLVFGGVGLGLAAMVLLIELLHSGPPPPPTRTEMTGGGIPLRQTELQPIVRPKTHPAAQNFVPTTYRQTEVADPGLDTQSEVKNEDSEGGGGAQVLNVRPHPIFDDDGKNDDVPAAMARVDRDAQFEISMGRHIPCNSDVAINTQLPGPFTCVIPYPVMNDDMTIELLPKGTHVYGQITKAVLFGNDRGEVGLTEIRTSDNPPIKIKTNSPATDAIGIAGVPLTVNNHLAAAFLATAAFSVLDYGPQLATAALQNGSHESNLTQFNQVFTPQQSLGSQILQKYINRPPTGEAHQGTRLDIVPNQDIDLAHVVHIRMRAAPP